jgi:hypothetical protein
MRLEAARTKGLDELRAKERLIACPDLMRLVYIASTYTHPLQANVRCLADCGQA